MPVLRRHEWLSRLLLAAVALGIALALAEIGVRIFAPSRGDTALMEPSDHPDLDYVLRPGASSPRASISSQGFRDREFARTKPPGTRRIVVVGDSVTFGMGVGAEETFPKQLEALLTSASRPVEVMNLGVNGYDVVNEVAFLEAKGLAFDPDVVVVGLCINDVGFHSADQRALRLANQRHWLLAHSQLARFLVRRLEGRQLRRDLVELNRDERFRRLNRGHIEPLEGDAEQEERMASLREALATRPQPLPFASWYTSKAKIGRLRYAFDRLAGLARKEGFEVWIAVLPYLDEGGRADVYRQVYDITRHEAERAGLRVLVLRDPLAAAGLQRVMGRSGRTLDPLHPNAEGHRLIAEGLAAALDSGAHEEAASKTSPSGASSPGR